MPVDPMDDIELRSVQLQFSNGRGSMGGNCDLHHVITDKGEVLVAIQGDTTKPAILTYHDLGLNCTYHRNLSLNSLVLFSPILLIYLNIYMKFSESPQMQQTMLGFSIFPRCVRY